MIIKTNKFQKSKSIFSLSKAACFSLVLALTSFSAKASETVVYDGNTYDVGTLLLDNSTYEQFYSIVSIQPWFQSNDSCYDLNNCAVIEAKFTSLPNDIYNYQNGVAIIHAPLVANYVEFVSNVGFVNIVGDGSSNTFANTLDFFGGVFCVIGSVLECVSGGGGGGDGPSAEDTLTSMRPNSSALKSAFNSQYTTLAYGLNHDCTIFDENGVCLSVFGRNTSLNDSSYDNNASGLVLAYKPRPQFRLGTYIDQSLNNNNTGGVKVERSNPDMGVFGVWNMNADGSGLELRFATNFGKRDLNVTRTVSGDSTAEAGKGKSDLNAYGALFEASFAHSINDRWVAKPYAGLRYLSIKRDRYSEGSTDAVENPLSYSGLKQETTSAVMGLRLNGQLMPKLMASLNAGFEHDLHHSINDYRASGVDDLGGINMNSQKDRTRPTAGFGISYDVANKQRITANVQYRKEIFMSESSVTGQINYTIGF